MLRDVPWLMLLIGVAASPLPAGDRPQWGERFSRNRVSAETNLPEVFELPEFDSDAMVPGTGRNVRWAARLGTETHGSPAVAGGKVFVGTNNGSPRDPHLRDEGGVVMCFDEATGRFLWQLVVPRLAAIRNADWYGVGLSSPPTVEDGRVYVVSNRGEVLCLDAEGMANGNDGPYTDEGRHMVGRGEEPVVPGKTDGDILWRFDMVAEVRVNPHNSSNCSILILGDLLYVCTSNGVDWTHRRPASPAAPSVIVLDKKTGRLVATDAAGVGTWIVHGQWSSPSYGEVDGRGLVFWGGGDGVCYAFDALRGERPKDPTWALKVAWSFDCDPEGRRIPGASAIVPAPDDGPSHIIATPVFHGGRVYVASTGDPWHGKRAGRLTCIDARGSGDITRGGKVWSYDTGRCVATVAVADGLVYAVGYDARVHCLDAATGKLHWLHKTRGRAVSSPLVADGKLYVGTQQGELWVLAAGREKRVLARIHLPAPMTASPVAANGVLYVATGRYLYAVAAEAKEAAGQR